MRLIITRVQPQASAWAQALQARGHDALALPLIETRAVDDANPIRQAWQHLHDYRAVMFVSAHAVTHFFEPNSTLTQAGQAQVAFKIRAWGTGPGTRAALLALGLDAAIIDTPAIEAGQFDSETLWQGVAGQVLPGDRVLIVRGDSGAQGEPAPQGVGREWLAQHLQRAGAGVDYVVAYARGAPRWDASQMACARRAATDGAVWVFSSAEAVRHLHDLMPGQDWALARAVATHDRIALAVQQLGFGRVALAAPTVERVLASIESLA